MIKVKLLINPEGGRTMKKKQNLIFLGLKGVFYIYLPVILLLSLFYYFVLERGFVLSWNMVLFYPIIIAISTISNYKNKTIELGIEDFTEMENYIKNKGWEILEKSEDGILIKPIFDFPFRMIIDAGLRIKYSKEKAIIDGPRYYVDNLVKDIKGKSSIWAKKTTSITALVITILLISFTISEDLGVRWEINKTRHNKFVENVQVIEFNSADVVGNNIENTNNYGIAVENEDYIFYIKDNLNLIRVDKDFQNEKIMTEKPSGSGLMRLNIAGDWVYYTAGEELNRISIDGTKNETIYKMGWLLDIHMKDKWIYYINFANESTVYKMDLNGRNLQKFLEIDASDIAIYEDRMIFSHIEDEKDYVESIKLDGSDRRLEFEGRAYNLIKLDDYYYYLGENYGLYKRAIDESTGAQLLVEGEVSSYTIVDDKIYYSLFSEEVGYPGRGVYQVELDGTSKTIISDSEGIEGFALVGDCLLFHSVGNEFEPILNKMDLSTGEIEIVE
jgi:hypothetical protein